MDKLRKSMEPSVTPKGKAPKSMGGNPEAKAAVTNPGDSDEDETDAEPEELEAGKIKTSAKKGKITNQFEKNEGDDAIEKTAKKSMSARLREMAGKLHKSNFDDGDDAPVTDASDAGVGDMGDEGAGNEQDPNDDASLEQALQTVRSHPRVLKAIAQAIAEALAGAPEGAAADDGDDEDYGEEEDAYPEQDTEDMSMSMDYPNVLAKAMAAMDKTGDLAKAISAEPVVGALAEYLVAFGSEMFARHDDLTEMVKSQNKTIASLQKSLAETSATVTGLAELALATADNTGEMAKGMSAIANTPRMPSPGVIVTRADGSTLQKSNDSSTPIRLEALAKALEASANRGEEGAAESLALIDHNPKAALTSLSDEARKDYLALIAG